MIFFIVLIMFWIWFFCKILFHDTILGLTRYVNWGFGATEVFEGFKKSGCWKVQVVSTLGAKNFYDNNYHRRYGGFDDDYCLGRLIIIQLLSWWSNENDHTWWATALTDLPEQRRFCFVGANMSRDSPGLNNSIITEYQIK